MAGITKLQDSAYLLRLNRGITLFGSEPSSTASVLIYIVPFSLIYEFNRSWKPMTILWSILLLLSGSTQTLVSFLLIAVGYMYIKFKSAIPKRIYYVVFVFGASLALFYTYGTKIDVVKTDSKFAYILYGKAVNFKDYSLQMRESSVINDMKVFFNYPITGVGDGIQGMLYAKNIPDWVKHNVEVQNLLNGKGGIPNGGGNFFPTFLSGYGLIGILLLWLFYKRYRHDIATLNGDFLFGNIFSLGLLLFMVSGWQTISVFNNEFMVLLLALPYINYENEAYSDDESKSV
ncbi:hypothetical protein [Parabacteroides sp.]